MIFSEFSGKFLPTEDDLSPEVFKLKADSFRCLSVFSDPKIVDSI